MAQPQSTPDDEAAMLLLRFFGQPVPDTSPGPSSPVVSQTLASQQKRPTFDSGPDPAFPSVLSRSADASQGETSTTASFQKEQDDSHPLLSQVNNDNVAPFANVNLKRKRIATDHAETLETRLEPAISVRSMSIETATSAPRARLDLPHFMGFDNQLYRCICGTTIEPEAGTSIQCESCLAWQHAGCFGLGGNELEGTTYFCELCSDETGKHQPDELYVKYVRHLAETSVPVHVPCLEDTKQPTDEYAKETKRSRFSGSSRGKGRVRQSATLPKPIEADVPEVPATTMLAEPVTVVPPRSQRKKSVLGSRIPKGKPLSVSGPVTQEHPLTDDLQDGALSREPLLVHETKFRILDYIPISDDLISTARLGGHGSTPSHLKHHPLGSKPLVQTSQGPSTNQSDVIGSTTKIRPFVPDSDGSAQLTFTKVVVPDNPMRSSISLSGIVAEHRDTRPSCIAPQYGVFARSELNSGQSIGQLCGEIYSLATYVQEPANQYAVIGLPKPFVQRIGSPFDVVVDARRYGNDLRFVRSSCEANAVLVPLSKPEEEFLTVEISLTRAVRQGEEITLPWAWDDFHLVHELRASPGFARSPTQSDRLAHIGRHLARVFKSCACHDRSTCLISRISELAFNLGPSTSLARDHTQSTCYAVSRNSGISEKRYSWRRSSPDATCETSFVHVELPYHSELFDLDLDLGQPYDLDYHSSGSTALRDDDPDCWGLTTEESSIDDFLKSSPSETEGVWHQDLQSSLSEGFAIPESTARSGIVWNTSSPSDMDVADEIASVSETSTLTEPIWQDDQEDDLSDPRSIGPRPPLVSGTPGGIVFDAAQLPDLVNRKGVLQKMGFDQAFRSSETTTANLESSSIPVDASMLPAGAAQSTSDSELKLDLRAALRPNAKADSTPVAGFDIQDPEEEEKPEIHAKKQRIDLTKFMRLSTPADEQVSVTRTYGDNTPAGTSKGNPAEGSHYSSGGLPSQLSTSAAVSAVPVNTPWWKSSTNDAKDGHQLATVPPVQSSDSPIIDARISPTWDDNT